MIFYNLIYIIQFCFLKKEVKIYITLYILQEANSCEQATMKLPIDCSQGLISIAILRDKYNPVVNEIRK